MVEEGHTGWEGVGVIGFGGGIKPAWTLMGFEISAGTPILTFPLLTGMGVGQSGNERWDTNTGTYPSLGLLRGRFAGFTSLDCRQKAGETERAQSTCFKAGDCGEFLSDLSRLSVLSGLSAQETGAEAQGQPFVAVPVHFPRDQRLIGIQAAV